MYVRTDGKELCIPYVFTAVCCTVSSALIRKLRDDIIKSSIKHNYIAVSAVCYLLSRLFELLEVLHPLEDHPLVRLLHLAGQNELVQYSINLVEVEHDVKLLDI